MQLHVGWVERSETHWRQFSDPPGPVGAVSEPHLLVSTSQITQRTRISAFVVAQFIAPLFFEYKRRYELRDYKRVLSLT